MVELYGKDYFTKLAYHEPCYFDFPAHELRAKKLIEITHPKSVLDVGCAYGYMVKRLLDKEIHAVGCDISYWCQEQAELVIPDSFKRCPTWELDFSDNYFDLIYCEGVLEHVPEDKIDQTFKEFKRVAQRFYLQISFKEHPGFAGEIGHVCAHDVNWWFDKIPDHSWLFLSPCGTEQGNMWLYKG